MSDLAAQIAEAIALKKGERSFCLYRHGEADDFWTASIGNTSLHVLIGESEPEWRAEGKTAVEAVSVLVHMLRIAQP